MQTYRDRVAAAQNPLIIGGGAVGVEMAGKIATSFDESKKVTLIQAQGQVQVMNHKYNDRFRRDSCESAVKSLKSLG